MRQDLNHHVGHRGGLAQALVQCHDVPALHRGERQLAERRHDVAIDDAAGRALRLRLAAHRDMLLEIAPGQVGHRRAACVLRRERQGYRVLPGLDPRDDERGPLARLLGAEHRVAADCDAPRLVRLVRPVGPPRLGDEDLAAGGIDGSVAKFSLNGELCAIAGARGWRMNDFRLCCKVRVVGEPCALPELGNRILEAL